MRVFILGTGRCGTTTLSQACQHMTNFSSSHESRARYHGSERLAYPDWHIEVDNRLSWFLGELGQRFGQDACYVHLTRDPELVARSFARRWPRGIIGSFGSQIIFSPRGNRTRTEEEVLEVCRYYVATVTANVEAFMDTRNSTFRIATCSFESDFRTFWDTIGAHGYLEAACRELAIPHNAGAPPTRSAPSEPL